MFVCSLSYPVQPPTRALNPGITMAPSGVWTFWVSGAQRFSSRPFANTREFHGNDAPARWRVCRQAVGPSKEALVSCVGTPSVQARGKDYIGGLSQDRF